MIIIIISMFAIPDMKVDKKSILLGMFLMFFILMVISSFLPSRETDSGSQRNLLSPNEACDIFYNCSGGTGTLGYLKCNCSGEWKTFGFEDFIEAVK